MSLWDLLGATRGGKATSFVEVAQHKVAGLTEDLIVQPFVRCPVKGTGTSQKGGWCRS